MREKEKINSPPALLHPDSYRERGELIAPLKNFEYIAGMKRNTYFFLFLFFIVASCNNNDQQNKKAEDDLDAARSFIDAALKGDFNKAKDYSVKDSINLQFLDVRERIYNKMDGKEKEEYRNASIHVFDVKKINDSTSVVIYANSFKNDKDTLKILKQSGQWLVDVKYLWQHDEDSIFKKPAIQKDSIR